MQKFKKVLIANRGEIAIRIARTCRQMGITTVGIFSEQDRKSLHLSYCDETYSLGEGPIAETYLNINKISEIIRKSKTNAVHPGYGFLSERAPFAEAVAKTGAKFIGPAPDSIRNMGDKIEAKERIRKMGVPLLPSSDGGIKDISEAKKLADKIGYPVLLKAAAGGGGKGMRIVEKVSDLEKSLESAAREAKQYFGDGTVYMEKYLQNPHHIEVQVLGDGLGGGGHVFDRECSIQRRHQKLVEESPAPLLTRHPKQKEKILALADEVVSKMKYANAGTLEFLGDDQGNFYFLEMNTRLQVEHPVTEWVTGLDLVERQIRVAMGEKLKPGAITGSQNGYAIEIRVYAETPFDYLPTGGVVKGLELPQGAFVRVDSAIYTGYEVQTEYDPTLMKLSVWGETRVGAIQRLFAALEELRILGVENNQGLFWCICQESDFIEGNYGTPYLSKNSKALRTLYDNKQSELLPFIAAGLIQSQSAGVNQKKIDTIRSPWNEYSRRVSLREGL
ncbi:MAG: acetyl/propionyl/methylcrotonyl-CoA carboxylase subunit alpha [Bacteriovoracia bacterium]